MAIDLAFCNKALEAGELLAGNDVSKTDDITIFQYHHDPRDDEHNKHMKNWKSKLHSLKSDPSDSKN